MSRMFHRALATSLVGAAALAAPATALAAASGGGRGAETPTSVVVHLPAHVRAGEPVTVTARVIPLDAAHAPADPWPGAGPEASGGKGHGHGKGRGHGGGRGKGAPKGGGHRTGPGSGPGADRGGRHTPTGEVRFVLDGRAEAPVEVARDQASEKIDIPLGRHTLVAEYSGDSRFEAASSAPVTFELTADPGTGGAGQGQEGPVRGSVPGGDQAPGAQDGPVANPGGVDGTAEQGQDEPGWYGPDAADSSSAQA